MARARSRRALVRLLLRESLRADLTLDARGALLLAAWTLVADMLDDDGTSSSSNGDRQVNYKRSAPAPHPSVFGLLNDVRAAAALLEAPAAEERH
jgi:hypothetical protein